MLKISYILTGWILGIVTLIAFWLFIFESFPIEGTAAKPYYWPGFAIACPVLVCLYLYLRFRYDASIEKAREFILSQESEIKERRTLLSMKPEEINPTFARLGYTQD